MADAPVKAGPAKRDPAGPTKATGNPRKLPATLWTSKAGAAELPDRETAMLAALGRPAVFTCSAPRRLGWWSASRRLDEAAKPELKADGDGPGVRLRKGGNMITSEQVKAARELLGWSQSDLELRANISQSTVSTFERRGRVLKKTVSALRAALEAAGVEFTNGGQPGVRLRGRMNDDLLELRERNRKLREKINPLLARANESVHQAIRKIAVEQPDATTSDTRESLERVYSNLRRRADEMVQLRAATKEDFEGLLWPLP
jgi:transcriptional regulator with XRE-family HTH domain